MKPPAPRTRPGVSLFRWCGCVVVGEHHWNATYTRCLYCGRKTTARVPLSGSRSDTPSTK